MVRAGWELLISAGASLVIGVAFAARTTSSPAETPWLLAVALLALATSVLLRRSAPLWSLGLAVPVAQWNAAGMRDEVPLWNVLLATAVISVIYLAGRRADREGPAVVILAVALVGAPALVFATGDVDAGTSGVVGLLCGAVLPWFTGRYHWLQMAHRERERLLLADRERASERARIARDVHDSLGHDLSLIALRAGALELAGDLDERRRATAGELRGAAAAATERLQQVIGVLRTDTGADPVPPAHEGVSEIVEHARAAGADVVLTRQGAPRALSSLVDRAVHRVVQEAVTNAVKHAPGAPIAVLLAFHPEEIEVTVTNEVAVDAAIMGGTGGRGLIGLRERVRLAGGSLHTAPLPQGGFEVAARLPDSGIQVHGARPGIDTTEGTAQ